MIKAQELRIGNLLVWNPKLTDAATTLLPITVEVASIAEDKIGYLSPRVEHRAEPFEDDVLPLEAPQRPLEELEPVVLTTEVAGNCGFAQEQTEPEDSYWLHDYCLRFVEGSVRFERRVGEGESNFIRNIHSLHQLQNLYFALTGEELSVEL